MKSFIYLLLIFCLHLNNLEVFSNSKYQEKQLIVLVNLSNKMEVYSVLKKKTLPGLKHEKEEESV